MINKRTHNPCLVLNADYTPLIIIDWKTAITWALKHAHTNNIDILEHYKNDFINGVTNKYRIPSIVKINQYIKINKKHVRFSRKNLFIRDNFTCQYCHRSFNASQLTYDHVIPKSKWTSSSNVTCWTNIVTACYKCNRKKANRTPKEAKMNLLSEPKQPLYHPKYLPWFNQCNNIKCEDSWKTYLSTYVKKS